MTKTSKKTPTTRLALIDAEGLDLNRVTLFEGQSNGKLIKFTTTKKKQGLLCPGDRYGCDVSEGFEGLDKGNKPFNPDLFHHATSTGIRALTELGKNTGVFFAYIGDNRLPESEYPTWFSSVSRALAYSGSRGAAVIAMPLRIRFETCEFHGLPHTYESARSAMLTVSQYAGDIHSQISSMRNTLLVVAAGNDNEVIGTKCYASWPGMMEYPHMLVVAASQAGHITIESNCGRTVHIAVDNIRAPFLPEGEAYSTSYATALMSAIATNIRAAYPSL